MNIFVYAPEEYRISRIMEIYGDDFESAKKNIRHSDEARASYYKSISGNSWGDRKNYHLMIDGSIGIEKSADVICSFINSYSK